MAPSKTRKKAQHPNPTHARAISQSYNHSGATSDLDLESDYPTTNAQLSNLAPPPPATRTNAELNLSVLQKYNPSIQNVLSIAPYAVIYTFSPDTEAWEKAGIEGSLFVVQLAVKPSHYETAAYEERFAVVILNRLGLENFYLALQRPEDVEVSDPYIILQKRSSAIEGDDYADEDDLIIYGLWIFTEPYPSSTAESRTINAQLIEDCASRAEQSRLAVAAEIGQIAQQAPQMSMNRPGYMPQPPSAWNEQQLSSNQLFGQNEHTETRAGSNDSFHQLVDRLKNQNGDNRFGQKGTRPPGFAPGPIQNMHQGQMPAGPNVLMNLFQKARTNHQSTG